MSGPPEDKQQKGGENVENIKFSLDTQLNFMFCTYSTLFCCLSTRGPDVSHPSLRFLYIFAILAYCVPLYWTKFNFSIFLVWFCHYFSNLFFALHYDWLNVRKNLNDLGFKVVNLFQKRFYFIKPWFELIPHLTILEVLYM